MLSCFSNEFFICVVVFFLACFCVIGPNANLDFLVDPVPYVGNGIMMLFLSSVLMLISL